MKAREIRNGIMSYLEINPLSEGLEVRVVNLRNTIINEKKYQLFECQPLRLLHKAVE